MPGMSSTTSLLAPHDGRPPTLLGVWAHPDDEAYLSAGLMAHVVDLGGEVHCVHATDGERGTTAPDRWPPERLRDVRQAELRASLAALRVTRSSRFGLPDGRLAEVLAASAHHERWGRHLNALLRETSPDLVVTFGPDGFTGHPDHQAISRLTTQAWCAAGRPGRLLYATPAQDSVSRNAAVYAHPSLALPAELAMGTDPARLDLDLRLEGTELDRKEVALRAHASQTAPVIELLGPAAYRSWIDQESFRSPRPDELAAATATPIFRKTTTDQQERR
jgi:LmbE family N-acetylglucosaminyl deacetylase